jgi:hypothetical protein
MSVEFSPAVLAAAAGVDPWQLAEQVRSGNPAALQAGALLVRRAGRQAAEAVDAGERADLGLAGVFHNDGTAVFDDVASTRWGAVLLADRGEKIEEVARTVLDVAAGLTEAAGTTSSIISVLEADLNRLVDRLRAVQVDGPDPAAVGAAAAAVEERYLQIAVDLVQRAGARIQVDLDAYGALLANRSARLAGLGYGDPRTQAAIGTALGAQFELSPEEERVARAIGEELAANPEAAAKVAVGLAGVVGGVLLLMRGQPALPMITRSGRLLGDGVVEIANGVADRLTRPGAARTPEARSEAVRESVLRPDGALPGEAGQSQRVRVVEQPEMDRIEGSIRSRLGPPDQVVESPGKGRVEIWDIAPDETVVVRDFSASGSRGSAGDKTIEIFVDGLEGVRKIHVKL